MRPPLGPGSQHETKAGGGLSAAGVDGKRLEWGREEIAAFVIGRAANGAGEEAIESDGPRALGRRE